MALGADASQVEERKCASCGVHFLSLTKAPRCPGCTAVHIVEENQNQPSSLERELLRLAKAAPSMTRDELLCELKYLVSQIENR